MKEDLATEEKRIRFTPTAPGTPDPAAAQRRLSNIGHQVEGALFAVLSVLALLQAYGALAGGARFGAPLLLLAAGLFLPAFIFGHGHGKAGHAGRVARDPQQREHLKMALLLLLSGAAELALSAGWPGRAALGYVWPAALGIIGVMFMTHTQHGEHAAMAKAVKFHRLLGIAILLAGIARLPVLQHESALAYAHGLLLLVAAAMLFAYREPAGAYSVDGSERTGTPDRHDSH